MVPNSYRAPGLAPCNEYWMPVTNMEKRQSIRLYCPLRSRQEANQEPQLRASSCWQLSRIGTTRLHSPHVGWRRAKQPVMCGVVVSSGDLDREPLLKLT